MYYLERILDKYGIELMKSIILAELLLCLSDFIVVAWAMNIGADAEHKFIFGDFLRGFLGMATIFADKAAEIALKKNTLLIKLSDLFVVLLEAMVAFWMRENDVPALLFEIKKNIVVLLEFATHWEFDEKIFILAEW